MNINLKETTLYLTIFILIAFLIYRLFRPMMIYVVTDDFAYPIDIGNIPEGLESISVTECQQCHEEITDEWRTSMHSKAWSDPYFQVDWKFEHSLQTCLNCHTPLKNQQPNLVLGFNDSDRLDPILKPNPDYDSSLCNEGVTCAVCHVKKGIIHGPHGSKDAPHPVKKDLAFTDGRTVCGPCHLVFGKKWDAFYKLPPCGTFDEIKEAGEKINCPKCHMPETDWGLWPDSTKRKRRKHLFHGGHYPYMVKNALKIDLIEKITVNSDFKIFTLNIMNIGTDHMLPTGTPDRHLTVNFNLFDSENNILKEQSDKLIRTIIWRPFIIDISDTRLKLKEARTYSFKFNQDIDAESLIVTVQYHLLDEKRRKRIGYMNTEPISYEVFRKKILINK